MKKVRSLQNQKGFSLLSTLVGLILSALAMQAFAKILRVTSQGQRSVENRAEFITLLTSLENLFKNDALCATSFKDSNGNPFVLQASNLVSGFEIQMGQERYAYVGKKIGTATINELNLEIVSGVAAGPAAPTNNFTAKLKIGVDNGSGNLGGTTRNNHLSPMVLNIETDASGHIKSCNSSSSTNNVNIGTVSCPAGKVMAGFNAGTGQAVCVDSNSNTGTPGLAYGGMFGVLKYSGCYNGGTKPDKCQWPNPKTNDCNCQPGYTEVLMTFDVDQGLSQNQPCWVSVYRTVCIAGS